MVWNRHLVLLYSLRTCKGRRSRLLVCFLKGCRRTLGGEELDAIAPVFRLPSTVITRSQSTALISPLCFTRHRTVASISFLAPHARFPSSPRAFLPRRSPHVFLAARRSTPFLPRAMESGAMEVARAMEEALDSEMTPDSEIRWPQRWHWTRSRWHRTQSRWRWTRSRWRQTPSTWCRTSSR